MRSTLRLLHILGLALFLGSIPGHVVLGRIVPGGDIPDQGVVFARMVTKMLTLFVTTPGLALMVAAGLGLWWIGNRPRWQWVHLGLGLMALVNGALIITPATIQLADQAQARVSGQFDEGAWHRAKLTEDVAGTANVALALVNMGIACGLRLRRRVEPRALAP